MRLSETARFGLLCGSVYVALAWAFRFPTAHGEHNASLVYPLDTFSMYADPAPARAGAFVARLEGGTYEPVEAFRTIDCLRPSGEPLLDEGGSFPIACGDEDARIEYLDADLGGYLRAHPGGGPVALELVRRIWTIPRGGAPGPAVDCVIATCRAAR